MIEIETAAGTARDSSNRVLELLRRRRAARRETGSEGGPAGAIVEELLRGRRRMIEELSGADSGRSPPPSPPSGEPVGRDTDVGDIERWRTLSWRLLELLALSGRRADGAGPGSEDGGAGGSEDGGPSTRTVFALLRSERNRIDRLAALWDDPSAPRFSPAGGTKPRRGGRKRAADAPSR